MIDSIQNTHSSQSAENKGPVAAGFANVMGSFYYIFLAVIEQFSAQEHAILAGNVEASIGLNNEASNLSKEKLAEVESLEYGNGTVDKPQEGSLLWYFLNYPDSGDNSSKAKETKAEFDKKISELQAQIREAKGTADASIQATQSMGSDMQNKIGTTFQQANQTYANLETLLNGPVLTVENLAPEIGSPKN
jgi:hypothetical protein